MTDIRTAVARALNRVNGPQLVSWPVFLLTLLVGVVVHFLGSPDIAGGDVIARVAAAVAGNLALFAVLIASAPLRARPGNAGRAWLVAALLLGGAARGVVLQMLLYAFGVTASLSIAYRLPAGVATTSFAAALFSGIVGTLRERAARLAAAQDVRDGLVAAIRALDERIEERQEQAAERIAADLHRQLDAAFGSTADLDDRLRDLADDVVRPLSHALAATVPVPQEFVATRPIARLRLSDAWRGLRAVDGLNPVWLTLIPGIMLAPAAFRFVPGDDVAVFLGVVLSSLFAVTAAARMLVGALLRDARPVMQAVTLTVALFGAITAAVALASPVDDGQNTLLLTGFVFIPLIGWTLAIVASSRRSITAADEQMATDTARLRWVSARLAAIRWQQQGDLSRALHGPVQAAIHAAVSQLARASADGADLGAVIATQRDALSTAIMRLAMPQDGVTDIDSTLATAAATWAGIATVDVDIDAPSRAALQSDAVSAGVFVDVAVEAVSNAIRHGRATAVSIAVDAVADDLVRLVIADNGRGEGTGDGGAGLGVELMRQCSIDFDRTIDGTGCVVRALLPVDPIAA